MGFLAAYLTAAHRTPGLGIARPTRNEAAAECFVFCTGAQVQSWATGKHELPFEPLARTYYSPSDAGGRPGRAGKLFVSPVQQLSRRSRFGCRRQGRACNVHRSALEAEVMFCTQTLASFRRSVLALGVFGQSLYVVVFMLSQLLVVVPVTPFMVAGALLFDVPTSYALVSIGVMGSAVAGFVLSRFIIRPQVRRLFAGKEKLRKISDAVANQGFRIALLARWSLVLPTAPMTFAFGSLTDVGFRAFFGATLLGSVPESWVTVYLAASTHDMLSKGTPWYFYAIAALAISALVHTIARIAKRALDESIED